MQETEVFYVFDRVSPRLFFSQFNIQTFAIDCHIYIWRKLNEVEIFEFYMWLEYFLSHLTNNQHIFKLDNNTIVSLASVYTSQFVLHNCPINIGTFECVLYPVYFVRPLLL